MLIGIAIAYIGCSNMSAQKTFTTNGVSFTMVYVQGGTFTMGATSEQGSDAYDDEKPTHSVTLSNYYIGETEVTQELWDAVMRDVNLTWDLASSAYQVTGSQRPVCYVSWENCQRFISKLNSLTGQRFHLPTEAQWEYAARGGNKSRGYKYSGSNDIGSVAWYWGNTDARGSHDVKTKAANELGIYDMSGNIAEWCQDYYCDRNDAHVIRGGHFGNYARNCRVSCRSWVVTTNHYYTVGLRLAL